MRLEREFVSKRANARSFSEIPVEAQFSPRLLAPALIWMGLAIGLPLLLLVILSFLTRGTYGEVIASFQLSNYSRLFEMLYLEVLGRSFLLALSTVFFCFLLGFPLAYWMATAGPRLRKILFAWVVVPFWVNFIVRVYSIKHLLSFFPESWQLFPSSFAVALGMVTAYLPAFVLPLFGAIDRMDFSLLEAARDLGATGPRVFFKVLMPQVRSGWIAGLVFVFTGALGEFLIPNILGGSKTALMGSVITDLFLKSRDWPFGAALAVLLLLAALLGLGLLQRYGNRVGGSSSNPGTGAGSSRRPRTPSGVIAAAILALLALNLSLVLLVLGSFRLSNGWGFDWYSKLFSDAEILSSLMMSLKLAASTAAVSAVLGTLAALAMVRSRWSRSGILSSVLLAPSVLPELIIGIGSLAIWSHFGVPLGWGVTWIAHVGFSMIFVILTVQARMKLLSFDLDEASADLGAGKLKRWWRVQLPLLMPAIVAGSVLAFSLSFDDFLISFFTLGSATETLPVKIFSMIRYGVNPEINAASTLLMGLTGLGLFLMSRLKID